MGRNKPEPVKAPFQQQQQQTNTYGYFSPYGQQGTQEFLNAPLDFGEPTDVDPGVARRTDLAEQEAENRAESVFGGGAPRFVRQQNLASELRGIRSQGAAEAAQARYMNQQANNAMKERKSLAELARRERLLPQLLQTGGSGTASGYNTQITQPQPGFWQRAGLSAIGGARSALTGGLV